MNHLLKYKSILKQLQKSRLATSSAGATKLTQQNKPHYYPELRLVWALQTHSAGGEFLLEVRVQLSVTR